MRQISISNGCRSLRSVDSGLRPNATEISLLAPPNFPFGEVQDSSAISFRLILRMHTAPADCRLTAKSCKCRKRTYDVYKFFQAIGKPKGVFSRPRFLK